MKNILLSCMLLISNIVFSQTVRLVNDTVYLDTMAIGNVTRTTESFVSIGGGDNNVRVYTLHTFYVIDKTTLTTIKKQLYKPLPDLKVKQSGPYFTHTSTQTSAVVTNNLTDAGQALKNASTAQIVSLMGGPLAIVNPFLGGVVALTGYIVSISELNRAGRIMMNEI